MERRDIRDTVLTLVILGAIIGSIGLAAAWGASNIDATQPVASAPSASTPIRGNFSTIKTEIEALQAQHPTSTDNALARYNGTAGTLQNGVCTEADSGALTCAVNGSTTALTITQAGSGGLLSILNGSNGITISNGGTTDIFSSTNNGTTLATTATDDGGVALYAAAGDGSNGTQYFTLGNSAASMGAGQCLTTVATGDDPKTCWLQSKATVAATTGTIQTIPLAADKIYFIKSHVFGRCTAGANCTVGEGAVFVTFGAWRLGGGAAQVIQGTSNIYTAEDSGPDTYCAQNGSGANVIIVCEAAAGVTYSFNVMTEISSGS